MKNRVNEKLEERLKLSKLKRLDAIKALKYLDDSISRVQDQLKCKHKNLEYGGYIYTTVKCKDCGASITSD